MKIHNAISTMVLLCLFSTGLYGQHAHSDLEFGYDNLNTPTAFEIEEVESTSDGFLFYEAEMEELDPIGDPGNFSSDEPGFTTNALEGLLINEEDQIWLNAVDAATYSLFGVGYVNYYNPGTDSLDAVGNLAVQDNTSSTDDLILSGAMATGPNPQFLGLGDMDGDLHDHVVINLLDDATAGIGAYGVMFQLQADFDPFDGNIDLTSETFWLIWNHGMSEEDFETRALPRFGVVRSHSRTHRRSRPRNR